jgi:hypothetical protein
MKSVRRGEGERERLTEKSSHASRPSFPLPSAVKRKKKERRKSTKLRMRQKETECN